MAKKPGIWCMEGDWSSRVTDVRSVRVIMQALKDDDRINLVYRHLNRPEDLDVALRGWTQKQHDSYRFGYLALHGAPETVFIGRRKVTWEHIESVAAGALKGGEGRSAKHLHFGSCLVMDTDEPRREEFRRRLGARSVSGFTQEVDWFESLAFELILFDALTHYKRIDAVEHYLRKVAGSLWDRTGFVLTRKGSGEGAARS